MVAMLKNIALAAVIAWLALGAAPAFMAGMADGTNSHRGLETASD